MNSGPPWPQALLEVCLCSGPPTQLIVGGLLFLAGVVSGPDGRFTLPFVASLAGLDTVLLVSLILGLLVAGGESPRQVLLGARSTFGEFVRGLWLVPSVLVVAALTSLAIAKWAPGLFPTQNPFTGLASTPGGLVVFALAVVIGGGVREEIQRAFILHRCEQRVGGVIGRIARLAGVGVAPDAERRLGGIVGLVGFGLLFGLGHYLQGWSAVIVTSLLGALWSVVYLMRRSVIAPMVSHAAFNLIQVVAFGLAA
jgi:membrane protease YdiL (CAAX protease family)